MLVILKPSPYTFSEIVEGKKVIAELVGDCYRISFRELNRVGVPRNIFGELGDCSEFATDKFYYNFTSEMVDVVEPKLVNCTDRNIGKGWS